MNDLGFVKSIDLAVAFQKRLAAASEVFEYRSSACLDFRNPYTVLTFRGLYRHQNLGTRWKALFGSRADFQEALRTLEALGIKASPCDAPKYMFSVEFEGPTQ